MPHPAACRLVAASDDAVGVLDAGHDRVVVLASLYGLFDEGHHECAKPDADDHAADASEADLARLSSSGTTSR